MSPKNYTVRFIKPSNQPAIPKKRQVLHIRKLDLLDKMFDFVIGSGVGFIAGSMIFLMLKNFGLELSGLESTVIVALPSVMGLFTSLIMF